ncbi:Omega-amino acid--pyruvate aminotransferase [Patulibacter medicamentivorans]|jgi:adenosylmethionine-8-amino-7-oxononanoate aminotransferase|uniref:Omega-amino acid--pyruvate aminotransferase n=1 Tax=Patulibacter medicamentivorans TaxID=1097667 RepID=H0E7F7_9ACTN|nr:aminotransferase class III-fold pyridoxal phosphate-dependent enzyme [Patulibacter medicamentivorans]EHN10377.1 Omega-amino acid--pyruvate aminotransferase [Patulibacter medicamentivorans]
MSPSTSALWHPFADMGAVESSPLVIDRAEGVTVWDEDGRAYLDATAALWFANLGHGRAELADVAADQIRKLDAYSTFGDYGNRPAFELADRLAGLFPEAGAKVFLTSGGGDSIDTAAKIARASWYHRGQPERVHLISRTHGYHGTHGFGTAIAGIPANLGGFGPQAPDASVVPHDDVAALEQEILRVGPERVAAFFCEPVIGAGGVHLPPEGYIEAAVAVCRKYGVLFIADCVICAFGRLGTWLGIDRWPVVPDLVTMAKGINGGVVPLGAVLVRDEVAAPFFPGSPGAPVLRHGATYAGHPVAARVALSALDIYEREGLIARGRALEGVLADAVAPLAGHELVGDVRAGLGLLSGIDLGPAVLEALPGAPAIWQMGCREAGVLVRPLGRGVAVSPPLTVQEQDIARIGDALHAGLEKVAEAVGAVA